MTPEQQRAGALEAIERIVNRGGDDDEVLSAVLAVVDKLDPDAADDPAFAARVATLTSPPHRPRLKTAHPGVSSAPGCRSLLGAPSPALVVLRSRALAIPRFRYLA